MGYSLRITKNMVITCMYRCHLNALLFGLLAGITIPLSLYTLSTTDMNHMKSKCLSFFEMDERFWSFFRRPKSIILNLSDELSEEIRSKLMTEHGTQHNIEADVCSCNSDKTLLLPKIESCDIGKIAWLLILMRHLFISLSIL